MWMFLNMSMICLSIIADCIKKAYAKYGYCYRVGGDEFCVLLKNSRNEEACSVQFESFIKKKRNKYTYLPSVAFGLTSANLICAEA